MQPHLMKGRKAQKREQSPLPQAIDMKTILSVLAAAMDHPKEFFIPTLEDLKMAHQIIGTIHPDAHFHQLSDPRVVAIITMITHLIEAQKVSDTPVASYK
jgi:hypothetical protein